MRVRCEVENVELEGDFETSDGMLVLVPSVQARCLRCGHETESYGDSEASVRRCLVLMREECPRGERNFYVAAAGEEG
jgi:hypothetical protein